MQLVCFNVVFSFRVGGVRMLGMRLIDCPCGAGVFAPECVICGRIYTLRHSLTQQSGCAHEAKSTRLRCNT
eukprot:1506958-Amphidinium_carterae.1